MVKKALALLFIMMLCGCAARAWPPAISIGQAEQCASYTEEYDANGKVIRVIYDDCLSGGALTKQGTKAILGVLSLPRAALKALIGP